MPKKSARKPVASVAIAEPPKKTVSKSDDRTLRAIRAKLAVAEGRSLSRQEQRDLAWYETAERDRIIDEFCESVPKGKYCELADRQHKQIDDAARIYELPLGGPTIDLGAAISALHDFIAANAPKLRSAAADAEKEELEEMKLRQQIAKLEIENARLQILLRRDKGEAIDRHQLASALSEVSALLREFGRAFDRFGADSRKLFNEMMERLALEIESGRLRF